MLLVYVTVPFIPSLGLATLALFGAERLYDLMEMHNSAGLRSVLPRIRYSKLNQQCQEALYPGQGCGGSGECPRNTGREMGVHPGWDTIIGHHANSLLGTI